MNDVLYLENDEDITTAIDRMIKSKGQGVSIVVPKRSTLLQSVINLRLLKKTAEDYKKELVLVTGDRTTTNLASRVGIPVAANVKSKAVLLEAAPEPEASSDIIEGEDDEVPTGAAAAMAVTPPVPAEKPRTFFGKADKTSAPDPVISTKAIEDDEPEAEPIKKDKGFKKPSVRVPDFGSMQKKIFIAVGVGVVALGALVANWMFASASVTLYAKASKIPANFTFSIDTAAKASDPAKASVVGQNLQLDKDLSSSVTATGKKEVGTKASGTMTVYNEYDSTPQPLVTGTRFLSGDGKVFRTTADVSVPGSQVKGGKIVAGTVSVAVEADQSGDAYNLGPARYTIPGLTPDKQAAIYGQGSQMSGGTTKEVSVVTQDDVNKAKAGLIDKNKDAAKKDLGTKVASSYEVLSDTFASTAGDASANPGVDAEATTTTVSVKVTYREFAVNQADYEKTVKAGELKSAPADYEIYDAGLDTSKLSLGKKVSDTVQEVGFSGTAYGGAKIDKQKVAEALKGKKYGDAADTASQMPGIERAEISLWPSWSTHLPHSAGRIKVDVKVSTTRN